MKNVKNKGKTALRIVSLVFITLFMVSLMSAQASAGFWDWFDSKSSVNVTDDNIQIGDKVFNKSEVVDKYGIINIDGWWGLGDTQFAGAIKEHTASCGSDCRSNLEIYLSSQDVLVEDIRFVGDQPDDYGIYVQDGTKQVLVDDYNTTCENVTKNVSEYNNETGTNETVEKTIEECSQVKVGEHYETKPTWRKYEIGTELPAGNYNVDIRGSKGVFEKTDWQIKTQGKWLEEWALWDEDTKAYYKLDGTSGDVVDATGNGNDGTNNGATRGVTGKINNAFDFDGSSSEYVDTSYTAEFGTGAFSINVWINNNNISQDQQSIFTTYDGNNGFIFTIDRSDYRFWTNGDDMYGTATEGEWVMVTIVRDGSGNKYIYENGNQIASGSSTKDVSNTQSGYMGVRPDNIEKGNDRSFYGKIDEVGIWDRALTSSEVSELYNSGAGETYPTGSNPPEVTLNSPSDGFSTDVDNNPITFNCSAYDDVNLANVSLYIDGTLNETNSSGINNTNYIFEKNIDAGSHNWTCGAYDNESQETIATARDFTISQLDTTLNSPADGSTQYEPEVTFNATGFSTPEYISNMSLYTNESGSWSLRETLYGEGADTLHNPTGYNNPSNSFDGNDSTYADYTHSNIDTSYVYYRLGKTFSSNYIEDVKSVLQVDWENTDSVAEEGRVIVKLQSYDGSSWNDEITFYDTGSDDGESFDNNNAGTVTSIDRTDVINKSTQGLRIEVSAKTKLGDGVVNIETKQYTLEYKDFIKTNKTTQTFTRTYTPSDNILWNVETCDTAGTCGFATSNYTFTMDDTAPTISIDEPSGTKDYGTVGESEALNFSINDTNLDTCWYNYNGTNITTSCSSNTTITLEDYGTNHNLTMHANDSLGNTNSESTSWSYDVFQKSLNYDDPVYETASETFETSFDTNNEVENVVFNYKGTQYSDVDVSSVGDSYTLSKTIDIPLGPGTNEFYFNFDADGSSYNTTIENHTVNELLLQLENGTHMVHNISILDEESLDPVNLTDLSVLGDYYLGSGDVVKTLTNSVNRDGHFQIYSNVDISGINSEFKYTFDSTGYQQRSLFLDRTYDTSSPTEDSLYLLLSDRGVIQYFRTIDGNYNAESDVLLKSYKLIGGEERLIGMAYTDTSGETNMFLDPDYNHKVIATKSGCATTEKTLSPSGTIEEIQMDCGESGTTQYNESEFQTYEGLSVDIKPEKKSLKNDTYNFSINFQDDECNIDLMEFKFIKNGIVNYTANSSNSCGKKFEIGRYVHNGTAEVRITTYINSSTIRRSRLYEITNIGDLVGDMPDLWDRINKLDEIEDLGMSQKTKVFLSFLVLFLLNGALSLAQGPKSGGLGLLGLNAFFIFVLSIIGWLQINAVPSTFLFSEFLNQYSIFMFTLFVITGILLVKTERR